MVGTASVKNQAGASVGTLPFTCFDSQGLKLGLAASDNGGSGMASLTYATTGAQPVAATTVSAASSQPGITTPGLTTLTYAARDVAGNQQATHSESIIVGHGLACASPTPALPMHAHGTLVANGTATSNGQSYPFSQTIPF